MGTMEAALAAARTPTASKRAGGVLQWQVVSKSRRHKCRCEAGAGCDFRFDEGRMFFVAGAVGVFVEAGDDEAGGDLVGEGVAEGEGAAFGAPERFLATSPTTCPSSSPHAPSSSHPRP